MDNKEKLGIKSYGEFILKDKDGNIKSHIKVENMVVNSGKQYILDLIRGSVSNPINYMAIGTGNTPASPTDTSLQTEISRKQASVSRVDNTLVYETIFMQGEGTGNLSEIGLFNQSSGGVMFNRAVFTPFTKGPLDILTVRWIITIK